MVLVDWVVVQHTYVHDPLLEVVGRDKRDTRGDVLVEFGELLLCVSRAFAQSGTQEGTFPSRFEANIVPCSEM